MSLMFSMNKGKAFLVYKFIWTFLFQILFIIIECSFHFVVFFLVNVEQILPSPVAHHGKYSLGTKSRTLWVAK